MVLAGVLELWNSAWPAGLTMLGLGSGFAVVLSFGAGIGFTMAICIMAGIRENLNLADVPECLKGAPITLITAGLLTLAFMGFAGMIR